MSDEKTESMPGGLNLDKLTVPQLIVLRDAAEAKRHEKLEGAKAALAAEMRERAAALGLTLEAVMGPASAPARARKPQSGSRVGDKLAAKFRGPNGEEWSGRGRLPKWLHALEATGRKREEFRR